MSRQTHRAMFSTKRTMPAAVKSALRVPVKWHKVPGELSSWTASCGTIEVAHAVMTGRPGVDDYPWDWRTSEALATYEITGTGVFDTLRAAKGATDTMLRTLRGEA